MLGCVKKGQLICLEYLHKNICPVPDNICKISRESQENCLEYLISNEC